MRRFIPAALCLLLIVAAGSPLGAQSGTVQPGAVIRATMTTGAGDALIGTLVSRTPDSLIMVTRGNDALVRLPSSSVRAIDVRNGKHRLAPAATWAVLGGAIWGGVATVIPLEACTATRTANCGKRSDFVVEQALGMAVITGVVGAVRGKDRWVRLEGASPTAFIAPSGGGGMAGLRLAF